MGEESSNDLGWVFCLFVLVEIRGEQPLEVDSLL